MKLRGKRVFFFLVGRNHSHLLLWPPSVLWTVIDSFLEQCFPVRFPDGSAGKESACSVETWIRSLGWEDPLEKGTTTHSTILA